MGLSLAACSMLGMDEEGAPEDMAEAPAEPGAAPEMAESPEAEAMTAPAPGEPEAAQAAEGPAPAPELTEGPVSETCSVERLQLMAAQQPAAASEQPAMAEPVEMTDMEAINVYNCLFAERQAAYGASGNPVATSYSDWRRFSIRAYRSARHGDRFVQNYANDQALAYAKWEAAGPMPAGAQLVKDSFTLAADGSVRVGPLFLMEKMEAGFNPDSDDWKYTLILPDGTTVGTTGGEGSGSVEFCYECHKVMSQNDSLMFVPEEMRGG